jgi:hypothetical protein
VSHPAVDPRSPPLAQIKRSNFARIRPISDSAQRRKASPSDRSDRSGGGNLQQQVNPGDVETRERLDEELPTSGLAVIDFAGRD